MSDDQFTEPVMLLDHVPIGCKVLRAKNYTGEPHIKCGELVVFDPVNRTPEDNAIVLIRGGKGVFVKRLFTRPFFDGVKDRKGWGYRNLDWQPYNPNAANPQDNMQRALVEWPLLGQGIRAITVGRVIGVLSLDQSERLTAVGSLVTGLLSRLTSEHQARKPH